MRDRFVVIFQEEEVKEDTEVKTEEEEPKPKPRRKKKKQTGRWSYLALSFTLCMLGNLSCFCCHRGRIDPGVVFDPGPVPYFRTD